MELGQIVAAGQDVYALSADHQGVYLWSSGRENWMKVGGPAKQLYAGGKNVYAVNPITGDLHGAVLGKWSTPKAASGKGRHQFPTPHFGGR
ncbi:hypothetical protein ACFVRB_21535 [Streptomyces nojiriensis]|uniref:hypothetical protein n=1 Tax=Streptomyces nojiriensis TaxID=66374 RepID=UPI0036DC1CC7